MGTAMITNLVVNGCDIKPLDYLDGKLVQIVDVGDDVTIVWFGTGKPFSLLNTAQVLVRRDFIEGENNEDRRNK